MNLELLQMDICKMSRPLYFALHLTQFACYIPVFRFFSLILCFFFLYFTSPSLSFTFVYIFSYHRVYILGCDVYPSMSIL